MSTSIFILDAKGRWKDSIEESALKAGISPTSDPSSATYGFIRPSPKAETLKKHQEFYNATKINWLQDKAQVDVYEDKVEQTRRWAMWMPDTWLVENKESAFRILDYVEYPFVSKSKEGSSSRNVFLINNREQAVDLINKVFDGGLPVYDAIQKGYVLFQKFIPHKTTYRVNAIGNARAVFLRYNYPDKWYCQTGNVEPADEINEEIESLLEYSDIVFENIGSKWCALDILKDGEKWKLLETSLAWPWPSPGRCNEGPIFRSKHRWIGMFDVLMDEIKAGSFG